MPAHSRPISAANGEPACRHDPGELLKLGGSAHPLGVQPRRQIDFAGQVRKIGRHRQLAVGGAQPNIAQNRGGARRVGCPV